MQRWDSQLRSLHAGQFDPDSAYTIAEVLGTEPVSIEDLKYACAIVSGRAGQRAGSLWEKDG